MSISASPVHSIHEYGNGIYKVVTFKGVRDPDNAYLRQSETVQHNEKKLDNNFSRARNMVLQYALCNQWDYFFTGTIDRAKFDRYDLDTYQSRLSQFIRDKRKKYQSQIQVLLVPEHHKDGAWHIHGLISGLPEDVISPFTSPAPQRLIDGGFLNWPDYNHLWLLLSGVHQRPHSNGLLHHQVYYLAFYDRFGGGFKGCIGDAGAFSQCVYRALDPTVSTNHTIKEIVRTGVYWINSTDLSSLNTHYVDSTAFDNISRKLHYNLRDPYIAIVKESVLLDGTPCYILKYLLNGKWVGVVCDQYGPIYCTTIAGGTVPGDDGTGESGTGATFDDTDIINAIDSVFRAVSSVDDSISYVSTYLSRLNNNFLNFYNDFKVKFEMQGKDLSNIYSLLLTMYQSFYDRFSDLDLTYYNDAEIVINNGGHLDWSESDRGAISLVGTDIGTLELVGFPDVAGYVVDHDIGGGLIVRRNDGTYFPNTWELSGGTVTMPAIVEGYASITVTAPAGSVISLAGNTHTMTGEPYSVNVEFGSYTIDLTYQDGENVLTASETVTVDGYNDYAVDFGYTPGGFEVTVTRKDSSMTTVGASRYYITVDGTRYTANDFYDEDGVFRLPVGSVIKFASSDLALTCFVYVDGVKVSQLTTAPFSYTVTSDCSIAFSATGRNLIRWDSRVSAALSAPSSASHPKTYRYVYNCPAAVRSRSFAHRIPAAARSPAPVSCSAAWLPAGAALSLSCCAVSSSPCTASISVVGV